MEIKTKKALGDIEILSRSIRKILIRAPAQLLTIEQLWEILEFQTKSTVTWTIFREAINILKENEKVRQNYGIIYLT